MESPVTKTRIGSTVSIKSQCMVKEGHAVSFTAILVLQNNRVTIIKNSFTIAS